MTNKQKGLFITFEGGEGAGKTTLIQKIAELLDREGAPYIITREPGGTPLAQEIRELLLHKSAPIDPKAELFLFLASRAQHIADIIKPALAQNKIVLCDRFQDSTVAYQGFARNLGIVEVMRMCEFAAGGLVPHLTLLLDIDPMEGLARAKKAVKEAPTDRLEEETLEFHQKVRRGFLVLADLFPRRIRKIDARLKPDEILHQVIPVLKMARL